MVSGSTIESIKYYAKLKAVWNTSNSSTRVALAVTRLLPWLALHAVTQPIPDGRPFAMYHSGQGCPL